MQKSNNGFTLIELIIVIAIIAIMAVVVFIALPEFLAKARDAQRLADANQIQAALSRYLLKESNFPSNRDNDASGWDCNYDSSDAGGFIADLTDEGYITTIFDPSSNISSCYLGGIRYYRYSPGSYSCATAKGYFYVLEIDDIETSTGTHEDSPGFSCTGRDWGTEAEWVTGQFQYPTL